MTLREAANVPTNDRGIEAEGDAAASRGECLRQVLGVCGNVRAKAEGEGIWGRRDLFRALEGARVKSDVLPQPPNTVDLSAIYSSIVLRRGGASTGQRHSSPCSTGYQIVWRTDRYKCYAPKSADYGCCKLS